ncbi:GGDEF domain-containing protein [Azoarcus sp. L1K30]|uniref:GGDEF domain-containing protein n=1 Tax=Azoarcus sp. L1K30 TaxID=2820277 RepID=UPI001B820E86|nr:GGDEF domain-containing protein [Azoarcus sp. L1K30]MBR0566748.1 GGDEF domain-containing protein [Azoarcus sp. L1K30]
MRFGIAARLALLLALVGVIASGVTGFYVYNASRTLLIQSSKSELLTSTKVLASRIVVAREEISRNLQLLSGHPDALAALDAAFDAPDTAAENRLAILFEQLMAVNPNYFQIRLIGAAEHGLERVRVDRGSDEPLRVGGEDLQEKGHYPYVFDTLKLAANETYLSRFAINHEQGAHAGLGRPTAQLGMPVVDRDGHTRGVVVINIDLHGVFKELSAGLPADFKLYLANAEGDFLVHPDPAQSFGFDRGRRILVQDEFPSTADLVLNKSPQVLLEVSSGSHSDLPVVAAFISQPVSIHSDESRLILGLAEPLATVLRQADALGNVILQIVLGICLACVLIAIAVARAVTRPINSMSLALRDFTAGAPMSALPTERHDEIGLLARSFGALSEQIRRQLSELQQRRHELEHLAQHDTLTGLPNRALFADRMEQALASARRDNTRLALMFIDLDDFKPINDERGHAVGDLLLKEVGTRIRKAIRESDTAARIGGDEFVVLLRHIQNKEDALAVAEKVRQSINQPILTDGPPLIVSASVGVATFPEGGSDEIELAKNADRAMYRAKQQGRNDVVIHQPAGQ